ncbi:hypothetical protein HDU93_002370 [Gonapodya sp. JEL0774]|nr:hypothetical protein HDU93_002370 [Gonapodya sp. JEL0774]
MILCSFQIPHLLVTQGFLYGLGMCISYPPCVGAVAQWHKKFRGVAVGLAVSGAGIGGFAIGPLVQVLIDGVGFRNSLRVVAAIVGGGGGLCAFMIVPRQRATPKKGFFDWRMFSDYASSLGYSASLGALAVGILNGASAGGRILMGIASDMIGPLNAMVVTLTGATISVFVVWSFSSNYGALIAFCLLYGFCAGGFISLTPVAITSVYGVDGIATRMGMYYAGLPWGLLVSPPIAGAILDRNTRVSPEGTKVQNYIPTIMFCGVFLALGTLGMAWVRFERAKWRLVGKA